MKNREVQRRSLTITIMFLIFNSLIASTGKSWGENTIITSATKNYRFDCSKSRNAAEIKREKGYNYFCLNYREMPQLPKDIQLHHPNFYFTILYKVTGNTIRYRKQKKILNTLLSKEDLAEWNKAVAALSEKYLDQIILVKK